MRYSKETIQAHYARLPERIRDFMETDETIEKILNIGKKYRLHIDQLNGLSQEVGYILHNIEPASNFNRNLIKYLGLSEDLANLITYDLNQEIFSQIRRELEKIAIPEEARSEPVEKAIEGPSEQEMFQDKMSGLSNVPKTEVAVPAKTEDNKDTATTTKPIRDPYREPIE